MKLLGCLLTLVLFSDQVDQIWALAISAPAPLSEDNDEYLSIEQQCRRRQNFTRKISLSAPIRCAGNFGTTRIGLPCDYKLPARLVAPSLYVLMSLQI